MALLRLLVLMASPDRPPLMATRPRYRRSHSARAGIADASCATVNPTKAATRCLPLLDLPFSKRYLALGSKTRIQRVTQSVAKQIQAEDGQKDSATRKHSRMWCDLHHRARIAEHRTPLRSRWLNPQAEKTQRRCGKHSVAEVQSELNDQWRGDIRQDVVHQDARIRCTHSPSGIDIVIGAHAQC